ncbi:FAD-binding oxidoreductase [Bradyrhizobium sp. NBAIM01]|uniref:FAD-binding oxidoreductase n=1 Tax=Bradyrhizobium sp. NBAIM01 TaxID=2793818 RepID=UPI001CD5DDB5|nr:FAD-binding oxidoreductase [Bradyrhizobium sp. NBAIM01]MCA1510362.1 FAD-binding oxidoreductase [Bradyrhizobium sp. NBAIM01]
MSHGFIEELRGMLDQASVLTDADIDERYYHDLTGEAVAKPLAVVRPTIVQAGAPLQRIQERVEQEGHIFPLDLGARSSCTIGVNISTNAGGNRVIPYGMARDLILGLEAVTADGTGLRKYVRNNTGIDLKQRFIGSEGILGVVTRAALRMVPAPTEQKLMLCALESFAKVSSFLGIARQRLGGELTAFEAMWNEYSRLTVERVNGMVGPLPTHHPFVCPARSFR